MTDVSYKPLWTESIRKRHNDLSEIVEWELFDNWEEARHPTVSIDGELHRGLDILYSGLDPELGRRFLDRAWALIERTERDGKLELEQDPFIYPLRRAEFLVSKALTVAVLEGVTRCDLFRQAAQDYVTAVFSANGQPSTWDDHDQARFLGAISSRLICGDIVEAKGLFDRAAGTTWYHSEGRLWRDLCSEWIASGRLSEPLKLMLWHHFDTVRHPRYNPEAFIWVWRLRLEFGAIMWKYVLENEGEISWQEVIELVSR